MENYLCSVKAVSYFRRITSIIGDSTLFTLFLLVQATRLRNFRDTERFSRITATKACFTNHMKMFQRLI